MRLIPVLLTATLVSSLSAGDWMSWRGPAGNGAAVGRGYATTWSAASNLVWKVPVAARGASTPVVAGDRIFLTGTQDGLNRVLCYNRDGRQLWQVALGDAVPGKPGKDGTGANPSAVTDGESVFAYFKSGDLGGFRADGTQMWSINLQDEYGEDTLWWDLGTSPVLTRDAVIVACMHSGPSYLAAFEKKTGKLLWKHERELGAPEEAAQSYATPVVVSHADFDELVVLGADHVTSHDGRDGKELWRLSGLNPTGHKYFRSIASAAVGDGIVVAPYARGNSLTAVRMGGTGDVTESHVIWANEETSADVPTPAIADGRVFVCRDTGDQRGTVDCLDLETGKVIWSGQLPKNRNTFRASPVVADGRVYLARQDGTVFVVDATADSFQLLAENSIADEHTVATPVFVDGTILLRTDAHLYLIADQ